VLFDEVEGDFGADAFDWVDVVAAEEDAEVDELESSCVRMWRLWLWSGCG